MICVKEAPCMIRYKQPVYVSEPYQLVRRVEVPHSQGYEYITRQGRPGMVPVGKC